MTIKNEETFKGLVLKNKPYKENDMLVWIYSREYGKLTLLAKGVKKMTSKNAPSCQSITLSEFTLIPKTGLSRLIKGSAVDYFRHIKEDIELEAYATYCLEFVDKYTKENDPDASIYDASLLALKYLNDGYEPKLVYLLFNAFILNVTGSSLEVDQCVSCGRQDLIAGISILNGGFVCQNCLGNYDRRLDVEVLKGFRYINKIPLEKIDLLHLSTPVINKLVEIMEAFVDEYTGINFKSRKFIKQLKML